MSETAAELSPESKATSLEDRVARLEQQLQGLERRAVSNRATIVVFSGDLNKVLAGLIIATGAAAMGLEVSMFHTFWGLNALRKRRKVRGKTCSSRR